MPDPYPADDFYPFTWEVVGADQPAIPIGRQPGMSSTLAAELVVDPGETGFASFTEDDAGLPATAADDAGTGTESWSSVSNALVEDDTSASVALGDTISSTTSGSDGHNSPGYAAATGSFTTPNNWLDAHRVKVSDGSVSVVASLTSGLSGYISVRDLGFAVPSDATITGVEVHVRRSRASGAVTVADWDLRMVIGGARRGNNVRHAENWPTSLATETYGGNSLSGWGVTPTAAQVNSDQFGFDLSVAINPSGTAQVDHISMKVYWRRTVGTHVDSSSHWLKLTNPGLSLPTGATPQGVSVRVRARADDGSRAKITAIKLVKGGSIVGQDLAGDGEPWLTSAYNDRTFGGAANRWGLALSEADVEASNFGVAISMRGQQTTARVDVAEITVHYLAAGTEVAVTGAPLMRFTPDDADPGAVPTEVSFQTEIPGGFSAGNMTVARSEFFDPERYVYAAARVYEFETNRTVYEGRVVGIADSGESVTFEMEGWAAHLEDDHSAKMIWYDRDLSSWQGMSVQRKLDLIDDGSAISDASTVADDTTSSPAVEVGVDGTWNPAQLPRVEGWYNAGQSIGFIDYAWKKSSTITDFDVFNWALRVATDSTDSSSTTTGDLSAIGPGSGTLSSGANKDWACVQLLVNSGAGTEGRHYGVFWTLLGVVGGHGLDLQGTVGAPATGRGLFPHQIIRYAVETWAPLLTVGEIEETDFVIPHATDPQPTTAREMIEKYCLFGGGTFDFPLEWFVYENRSFGLSTPGHGRLWRTRYDPDGTEAAESGPDVQRLINGCVVTYNDGVSDLSVGPPNSGATETSTELIDISDSNPANRTGANHWEVFNAGVTTQEAAVQIGKMILAERNRQEWRGEVRIKEWVLDDAGNEHPAAVVRAGDRLIVEDDDDTRERNIVQTSYDADSETVSCSIGASPDRLDTLLARLSVVLEGRLS